MGLTRLLDTSDGAIDLVRWTPSADVQLTLGDAARLEFTGHTVATDASIREQPTSIAPLQALIDRAAHNHQLRWCTRSTLSLPGTAPLDGWMVREVVRCG